MILMRVVMVCQFVGASKAARSSGVWDRSGVFGTYSKNWPLGVAMNDRMSR